jgi:DNA invertase Pin-like site-specific DNA recombinase
MPAIGYSYIRFSTKEQRKNDSLRRQTEAAARWCEGSGVTLDTSRTLHDLGKSAFLGEHRKNPDRYALAAFLKLVEQGKIPRGSYLVIESLDRLTREHVRAGLMLCLGLIENGIRIVQLSPTELVYDEKSDEMSLMLMIVELSRGHRESKRKSDTIGPAWKEKKRRAVAGEAQRETREMGKDCYAMTRRLPAWVVLKEGRLALDPVRAEVVARIFQLSASGYGYATILKKLTADKVKPFGPSGKWVRSYVAKILKDRRALGELKIGGEVATYYPPVVSEKVFDAAQGAIREHSNARGRPAQNRANVFQGLTFDARTGGKYYVQAQHGGEKRERRVYLVSEAGARGLGAQTSFPFPVFERAILSCLREIDPHEILNGDAGPDESLALAGELAAMEAKIAELEAELLERDVSAVARVLARLEARQKDLAARLAEARQKAAHPLSESWVEAQTLLKALDSAPDPEDARLRLRAALRRIIDGVWVLVVARGASRLAAVQIWFAGKKKRRDYLILHQPAKANARSRTEGGWWAKSLARAVENGGLDLRDKSHAAKLEKVLASLDLDVLRRRADCRHGHPSPRQPFGSPGGRAGRHRGPDPDRSAVPKR